MFDLFKTNGSSPPEYDVRVMNHGSLFLVHPITKAAEAWLLLNVQSDAQRFGEAVVVEPRYVSDLVVGMAEAGLRVSGGRSVL